MLKKAISTLLMAGALTSVSVTGAYADNGKQPVQVVALTDVKKMTADQIKVERERAVSSTHYASAIEPELVKSPNYTFWVPNGSYFNSPNFSHTAGDILVTLVQWNNGWTTSADLNWSIYNTSNTRVAGPIRVQGDYTDTNHTINFGYVPTGTYYIRISNPNGGDADGNFFIYY